MIGIGVSLAKWLNTRYGTNYSVNDLKKIPRDEIDEKLIERVFEQLAATDLSEGAPMLYGDDGSWDLSRLDEEQI